MPENIDQIKLERWMLCVTRILDQVADHHGLLVERFNLVQSYKDAVWRSDPPNDANNN